MKLVIFLLEISGFLGSHYLFTSVMSILVVLSVFSVSAGGMFLGMVVMCIYC